MPVDIYIVNVREFLSATVTGEFDLSVGKAARGIGSEMHGASSSA